MQKNKQKHMRCVHAAAADIHQRKRVRKCTYICIYIYIYIHTYIYTYDAYMLLLLLLVPPPRHPALADRLCFCFVFGLIMLVVELYGRCVGALG